MRKILGLAGASLAVLLTACATGRVPRPSLAPPVALAPVSPPLSEPAGLDLADLPGWLSDDHAAALTAFQRGCGVARDSALREVCARARMLGRADDAAARLFFETHFRAVRVGDQGLLTAYFAPEYEARAAREPPFTAPVRNRPADLIVLDLGLFDPQLAGRKIAGRIIGPIFTAYPDRAAIERTQAIAPRAWMRPEDLFFMQIQGSGVLNFPDGRSLRATFAGSNDQPFVGIAAVLRDRNLLPDRDTSGDAIRRWLSAHRGVDADAIMQADPRYVFFDLSPDDCRDPAGAAGVPLIAGRSLAVDPSKHGFGAVYWIDASAPALTGAFPVYRRLALALDTGGAIKGEVRADLYTGRGSAAGVEAGRVRHTLRLYRLTPVVDPAP